MGRTSAREEAGIARIGGFPAMRTDEEIEEILH